MGTIYSEEKNDFKENKNYETKKIDKENSIIIPNLKYIETNNNNIEIPNPNFRNKDKITDNYLHNSFEIFKLNKINDAFYIAFSTLEKAGLNIYKYYYKTKKFKIIYYIKNLNFSDKLIKYFYNPIENNEYLYILNCSTIYIYLIANESNYFLINSINKHYDHYYDLYSINYFDIIYNQYNKNIYFLLYSSYWNKQNCIELIQISNNKYSLITSFPVKNDYNYFKIKLLLYEDKFSQKYNIILIKSNLPKIIEIKDEYNYNNLDLNFEDIILSQNGLQKLNNFCYESFHKNINIISQNNKDYLYISNIEGKILIFDLSKKELINEIYLFFDVRSAINWNNKYIIFMSYKSLLIYDTNENKKITKYSNIFGENKSIYIIKTHFCKEYNFFCLFTCGDNEIILQSIH